MSPPRDEHQVVVEGRRLRIRNLGKVLYPATGFTKGDVLAYYQAVAPVLVPHLRRRPLTLKRYPDGVEGPHFYEKSCPQHRPDWIPLAQVPAGDRTICFCTVDDLATLTWVANLASLELHPLLCRAPDLDHPDLLVFDLDPGPPAGVLDAAQVAVVVRDTLARVGLDCLPRSSGSKGIHVLAGLAPTATFEDVKRFARELAAGLERVWPERVVSSMRKSKRDGKVLVDWSQNDRHKSTVASYSLRAQPRPTVAAPLTWDEVEDLLAAGDPDALFLESDQVLDRVARLGDLHAPLLDADQELPAAPASPRAKLATYRRKRDFTATPEPEGAGRADPEDHAIDAAAPAVDVDDATATATADADADGNADAAEAEPATTERFVIHQHDATRLHWDLRLEHEGVLASWALPRGVPWSPGENRLAVHTEDHPLEYLDFHGEIPEGSYGAGTMVIWDEGRYEPVTFADDKVVVVLHGERVEGRHALFPVRGRDWMIHRMDPPQDPTRRPLPDDLLPMEAGTGRLPTAGDDRWWFEPWWPGRRVLVANDAGHVTAHDAAGLAIEDRFPELHTLGRRLAGTEVVLDGVLTGRPHASDATATAGHDGGDGARSPLAGLDPHPVDRRLAAASPSAVRRLAEQAPVVLIVFDLLWLDGHPVLDEDLAGRRRRLDELGLGTGAAWTVPRPVEGDGADLLAVATAAGLPGVVAKRHDSRYRPGSVTRSWRRVPVRPARARANMEGGRSAATRR